MTSKEKNLLATFGTNAMYLINRMRRSINVRRMAYDFDSVNRWEADNCPEWMRSKLFSVVTAKG